MRVIALTGEAERCEHFIEALMLHHKVAILRQEHENTLTFAQKEGLKNTPLHQIADEIRFDTLYPRERK